MAVAFDAASTSQTNVTAATSITHNNMTVGSGANRALVVFLSFTGSTQPASLSVHWDSAGANQLMTQIVGTAIGSSTVNGWGALYGLVAPTSGNKTLSVTWTGSLEGHAGCVSFTGADQTGGVTTFPHGGTNSGNTTSATITITSATGNQTVSLGQQSTSLWASNTQTLILEDNVGPVVGQLSQRAAGAATVVHSGGISGGSGFPWIMSGCDILAAGASNPFNQLDWPNPRSVQWYKTWESTFPKELIGQGKKPFLQSDWPNPYPVQWYRTWEYSNTRYYGQDTVVPGKRYTDRPDPVIWYRSWEQPNIRVVPRPFKQSDWPNPIPVVWYRDVNQNLVLTRPSGKPFNQQDYPNPIPIQWYRTWEQAGFKVIPIPFRQQDWPVPRPIDKEIRSWTVPGYDPPNIILLPSWWDVPPPPYWDLFTGLGLVLTHPSGKPFNQQDWPNYRPTQPYWDNFIGENGVIYLPTPIPPITTDLHFKFWHEAFGRMGNLGGVN